MSKDINLQMTSPRQSLQGYPLRLYTQALDYLSFMAKFNLVSSKLFHIDNIKNLADLCQGIVDTRNGNEKEDPSVYHIAGQSLVQIANCAEQRVFLQGISRGCTGKPLELKDHTLLIGWVLGATARDEIYRRSRRLSEASKSPINNSTDYIIS